ncbi:MAG: flavodoxin [Candidatus Omnitrophota bacterium]
MKRLKLACPMIMTFLMLIAAASPVSFAAKEEKFDHGTGNTRKVLIAYFSHTGNTREIASQIHERVGGDIFEIQTVAPYTENYDDLVEQAKKELHSDFRPELRSDVQDVNAYDVIFIGYPSWWETYPMAVKAFLSKHDLSGKTLVPFCTHEGSGLGQSVFDLSQLCPRSTLLDGLAVRGRTVRSAQSKVSEWLREIKMVK